MTPRCQLVILQQAPDGQRLDAECADLAYVMTRNPRAFCCLTCFEEIVKAGHLKDFGGVQEIPWAYYSY